MPKPDSDEINLRLQAYQLAVAAQTTPDLVYQWLTQEGTPGERTTLASVAPLPGTEDVVQDTVRADYDPDERRRAQLPHPAAKEPETNYLLPENAHVLAAAFLRSFTAGRTGEGDVIIQPRHGITEEDQVTLLTAAAQGLSVYGGV